MDAFLAIASKRDVRDYADAADPAPTCAGASSTPAGSRAARGTGSTGSSWSCPARRRSASPTPSTRRRTSARRALVVAIVGEAGAFDAGRCAQNMMLAAWGEGVGSCPNGIRDADAAAEICGGEVKAIISFGYPAKPRAGAAAPRSGRRGPTASRSPSSCAKSRSRRRPGAGRVWRRPPQAASRRRRTRSARSPAAPRPQLQHPSSVPRQPADACQYGDQRTATRYVPARATRSDEARLAEREHGRPAGPASRSAAGGDGVDRDVRASRRRGCSRFAAADEPLLGASCSPGGAPSARRSATPSRAQPADVLRGGERPAVEEGVEREVVLPEPAADERDLRRREVVRRPVLPWCRRPPRGSRAGGACGDNETGARQTFGPRR